jgi:hypothetical protein
MLILEIALGVAFGLALAPMAYRVTNGLRQVGAAMRHGLGRFFCHRLTIIALLLLLNHVLDAILSSRLSDVSSRHSSLVQPLVRPLQ